MTIWRMRVACWIGKATCAQGHASVRAPTNKQTNKQTNKHTHTHTQQYIILNAFTRQQWLRERSLVLRYTYTACLVYCVIYGAIVTQC